MGEDEVKLMDEMQKAKKTPAQILVRLHCDSGQAWIRTGLPHTQCGGARYDI
jgi:hypothetical protein